MTAEGPIERVVRKARLRNVPAIAVGSRRSDSLPVRRPWGIASKDLCSMAPFSMLSVDGVDDRESGARVGLKASLKRREVQLIIVKRPTTTPRNHHSSFTYSDCRAALSLMSSSVGEESRSSKADIVEKGMVSSGAFQQGSLGSLCGLQAPTQRLLSPTAGPASLYETCRWEGEHRLCQQVRGRHIDLEKKLCIIRSLTEIDLF